MWTETWKALPTGLWGTHSTVTGEWAKMQGKKWLQVTVAGQAIHLAGQHPGLVSRTTASAESLTRTTRCHILTMTPSTTLLGSTGPASLDHPQRLLVGGADARVSSSLECFQREMSFPGPVARC